MATATKKPAPGPRDRPPTLGAPGRAPLLRRAFDSAFRFLASLKLAVICLATLAGTLAYGTKFNSAYGLNAANEYIYQTKGFALLLAFLAANVLCAALIRYPWHKRQIGFLITHLGLLVTIAGSWWAATSADEGLLGMREGETNRWLIRTHKPVLRVRPIDPHSGKPTGDYSIPIRPGAFDWEPGRSEIVTQPEDPFQITFKNYHAASAPRVEFAPDPAGTPMVKLRPMIVPPGSTTPLDVFPNEGDRWFQAERGRIQRAVKDKKPARFLFTYVNRPEILDDFLDPPADPGPEGVARLRYTDKDGKPRRFDVAIDGAQVGKPIPLPDSDLTASFSKVIHDELEPAMLRMLGEDSLNLVQFKVRTGDGPELEHNGFSALPMAPSIIPSRDDSTKTPEPLVQIGYYLPPVVDPRVNGRFGVIEVMGDDKGRLGYRVFGRGIPGKLVAHGPIEPGGRFTAFGGTSVAPMTMTVDIEAFLQGGREREVAVSVSPGPSEIDNAIPAALVEMTVAGVTKEFWLRKTGEFQPDYRAITFPGGMYEVAFDSDRVDLGFSLKLNDFDVGFDPGTTQAASFRSEVTLTDEAKGIKDEPHSIYMNHTLDHDNWRFFQSNYSRYRDPKTRQETGEFVSVFSVAKNPARGMTYAGCIIVVLGAFVQFYMRAGIFTDGGKIQRERAAAKARDRLAAKKAGRPMPEPEGPSLADEHEPL